MHHYETLFTRSELYKAQTEGYIRIKTHDDLPLGICTYTEQAQFDNHWNNVTLNCRGLVIDFETGEIVSWPFAKFFNSGQHHDSNDWAPKLPDEPFDLFDKMDGSLISVFYSHGRWMTASKGSFDSHQARWAQERINRRIYAFRPGLTYMAEAIYPENRIVVDYKGLEDLVLLGVRDNATGRELPLDVVANSWRGVGSVVKQYLGPLSADFIKNLENFAKEGKNLNGEKVTGTEAEGYVARFLSGVRVKIKLADYLEAHKLFTNTNERTVWGWLSTGQPLADILSFVPDEYAVWAKEVAKDLQDQHARLICDVEESFDEIMAVLPSDHSRKDFALMAIKYPWSAALFAAHDGAGLKLDEWAWKQIRPKITGGSTVIRAN